MPPGPQPQRGPTMRDVAREAGVSKALVSVVFRGAPGASEQTRRRVFEAAERLGYRANRSASLLALSRTRQLGIVLDLRNGFHIDVAEAAMAAAQEAGYHLALSPIGPERDEAKAVGTALEFRCEALLVVGATLGETELARLADGAPVVCVGRQMDDSRFDVVRMADETGMELVVDHLVGLGHRRIAHIDGGAGDIPAARRAGFERATRRHRIVGRCLTVPGGHTEADGRRAAQALLRRRHRPTAIAAFNDRCAIGALEALDRAGLAVPHDLSVTGYDDSPLARLEFIDLTSVRQDAQQLGCRAVEAAVQRLDEGRLERLDITLTPVLAARASSGPPGTPPERRTP